MSEKFRAYFLKLSFPVIFVTSMLSILVFFGLLYEYAYKSNLRSSHIAPVIFSLSDLTQFKTWDEHEISRRSATKLSSKGEEGCHKAKTCENCASLSNTCLWCETTKKCTTYSIKKFLPWSSECEWDQARWGVCWIDLRAVAIAVGVIAGIILLITCCCVVKFFRCISDCFKIVKECCCCCCCSEERNHKLQMLQLKKIERKLQTQALKDNLRLKFGTQRPQGVDFGSTGNYTTFENDSV